MNNKGLPAEALAEAGQSLIEVIVAVTVGVLVVSALTFAVLFSLRNAKFSQNQNQATKLAQEGIERVRTGRDRNQCISNLDASVKSWNGNSGNSGCSGAGSIWNYQITGTSSTCENTSFTPSTKCYFTVDSNDLLTLIGFSQNSFPLSFAEGIPTGVPIFRRAVTLSDETGTYDKQKTITVIVTWTDSTGSHESRLTTILRKL